MSQHSSPGVVDDATLARGLEAARDVLRHSAAAAAAAAERSECIADALALVLSCRGRVIVTGLGKSGLIGAKLAATLASTGTPAQFVHAADALHGDVGMVTNDDVLLALSKSGETAEVIDVVRIVAAKGVPVISLSGCGGSSTLAGLATVQLDGCVEREGDPWDLVPTTSTTVSLILGDALAIAAMAAREFGPSDFKVFHPGGSLGRRLSQSAES